MKRIDSYVGSSVLWAFFAVIFILLGLDYILTFIEQIKKINDNYSLANLSLALLLHLPNKFTEYIPIASLIGTLIGLGALASTSELTVIRAAGIPLWRIGYSAARPLLIISLIGVLCSEFISPQAEQKANLIESLRKQNSNELILSGGVWFRSEQHFIYINAADANGKLYNMEVFTKKGNELESIQKAKTATHQKDDKWLLKDVSSSYFFEDHIKSEHLPEKSWVMSVEPEHLFLAAQEINALSLSQSLTYQAYLAEEGLDTSHYRLDFWTKIFRPLATISLMLVALSSVFGPLRSSTMGGRVFSGVIMGIVFQNGLNLFGRMSLVADFSPIFGILFPISICLAIGVFQLRKLK